MSLFLFHRQFLRCWDRTISMEPASAIRLYRPQFISGMVSQLWPGQRAASENLTNQSVQGTEMNGFLNEQLSGSRAHSTVALAAIGLLLIYILPLKGESILSRPWGSTLFICFPDLSELFRLANEFIVAQPTLLQRLDGIQSVSSPIHPAAGPSTTAQNQKSCSCLQRQFPG